MKRRNETNEKSNQANSDCLEMWRDLSSYEANFVNSSDTSVVSRLAKMKTKIASTAQKMNAIDKRTGKMWMNKGQ